MGVPPVSLKDYLKQQPQEDRGLILSGGEVSRFADKCDRCLTLLLGEGRVPSPIEIHRGALRLTWSWFYARKAAAEEEHERLLLVFLGTLEQLHNALLSVEPVDLIERVVVEKAPRRSSKQAQAEARAKTIGDLLGE